LAIIVDKKQKKIDIAFACKELILNKGINNITISEVAKSAKIGKGTVYEYFSNKDEIVFELVNILMSQHIEKLKIALALKTSTKDKILEFSTFFYSEDELELRKLYKEFISISLASPRKEMLEFQAKCTESYFIWFYEIIQAGVDKGELKKEILLLAKGIFVVGDGMFMQNSINSKESDIENDLTIFIDTLFSLMEIK